MSKMRRNPSFMSRDWRFELEVPNAGSGTASSELELHSSTIGSRSCQHPPRCVQRCLQRRKCIYNPRKMPDAIAGTFVCYQCARPALLLGTGISSMQ